MELEPSLGLGEVEVGASLLPLDASLLIGSLAPSSPVIFFRIFFIIVEFVLSSFSRLFCIMN